MKFKTKLLAGLMLLSGAGLSTSAMALCPGVIALPDPSTTAISFGDGLSYSLPILGLSVQSSPGQIDDCIVVATGTSGGPINNNGSAVIDNPYATPSGSEQQPANPYFRTGDAATSPDPGGTTFIGDTATTWDTSIAALQTFLGGNDLVFFFNHNQTASGGDAINESLAVWMQIRLWTPDAACNFVGCTTGASQYFYLTATSGELFPNFGQIGDTTSQFDGPQTAATCPTYPAGPDCTPPLFPTGSLLLTGSPFGPPTVETASYFVLAQGQICLGGTGAPGSPIVACDGSQGPVAATFNENLGANEVANAVVFPEINALLDAGTFTNMSIDLRMGCLPGVTTSTNFLCPSGFGLNNGFEQLFIARLSPVQCVDNCGIIPEPTTVALFGLGLFAAGLAGRTRRRKI